MRMRFLQSVIRFVRGKRNELRRKFNRVLPLNELLTDRWEKAQYLGFGKGTSIYDSSLVFGSVEVGDDTWIGPFTILDGSGGLKIGNHCSISAGVHIYSHNTVMWAVSKHDTKYEYFPTQIGNHCFIGPHAIIQNNVNIGNHCVVAANSFVNRDVPDFTIVGGSPAKEIGRVELDVNGVAIFKYNNHQ